MSGAGKTIYRVRHMAHIDVAVLAEVKDETIGSGSGKVVETRSERICLGGPDSYWLVTGEKPERTPAKRPPRGASFPAAASSSLSGRTRTPTGLAFPELHDVPVAPPEVVVFSMATRLQVAYTPPDGDYRAVVEKLREGVLEVSHKGRLAAVEVGPDRWLLDTEFERTASGLFRLGNDVPAARARVYSIEPRLDTLRLKSGLLVFPTSPNWIDRQLADLRPKEEIFAAAESWLMRTRNVATSANTPDVVALLRQHIDASIEPDEVYDLEAALCALSSRAEMQDIVPAILRKDPAWLGRLEAIEAEERERLRGGLRKKAEAELAHENERLADLRAKSDEAEARIATFTLREGVLRAESEKLDSELRERLAAAALELSQGYRDRESVVRSELEALRRQIAELTAGLDAPPPAAMPSVAPRSDDLVDAHIASDAARGGLLANLSKICELSTEELVAAVLQGAAAFPVFLGNHSDTFVVRLVTSLGGNSAGIVFCDPTRLSLEDYLNGGLSGFSSAIEFARRNPSISVPVGFCGLTASPCEYWLTQLLELRRIGRIPRNLAFFASAASDGMRVSVPASLLSRMVPVKISMRQIAGSMPRFEGYWPYAEQTDARLLAEAVDVIEELSDPDPAFLKDAARMLAHLPTSEGVHLPAVAKALAAHNEWSSAVQNSADHELLHYFQNIEG